MLTAATAPGVVNKVFQTRPLVMHAHGHHDTKPAWPMVRDWYAMRTPRRLPPPRRITAITCNNGHPAMGLFEESCERLGLEVLIAGHGITPWDNARHKPPAIVELLGHVRTPYALYVDSRDGLLLDDPEKLVDIMETFFTGKALVFGGDRMNWPTMPDFKRFEDTLAARAGEDSQFRYLNGGAWVGRTAQALAFFQEAARTPPHPAAPSSEQGILKSLLPCWAETVGIDYRCRMIQNLGFTPSSAIALQ